MTPRTNPDLIPGAPWWANALIKLGAFGVLAGLLALNGYQNSQTSTALVASNSRAVDTLPLIAAEIRDDNRRSAEFMRTHTANAVLSRDQMNVRLAAIEKELVSIRADQQATSGALLEAINRLITLNEGMGKNLKAPPTGSGSGA